MAARSIDELQKYAFTERSKGSRNEENEPKVKPAKAKPAKVLKGPLKSVKLKSKSIKSLKLESPLEISKDITGQEEQADQPRIWKPLLQPNLKLVFIGFNPGMESWRLGHYYAHPTNLFWKLLYESGLVDRHVTCYDDTLLPDAYGIGFTDLVSRSTRGISDLTTTEMLQGVAVLEDRLTRVQPKMICIVGKGIWAAIYRAKTGGKPLKDREFAWGMQPPRLVRSMGFVCEKVFVVPSTSGLVGGISRAEKLELWKELASTVRAL